MDNDNITLCFPDKAKTCFACCPPIRPKGYEHIQYRSINSRIFRENTSNYTKLRKDIIPITGFSCWALGYLDEEFKLIGCLLHPARNQGKDLRYRIDYGEKCRRESCWESRAFKQLSPEGKRFWLGICDGMDSFEYSSRKHNLLFRLLGWGPKLLEIIAAYEQATKITKMLLFEKYPFFETRLDPRSNTYLLNFFIRDGGISLLRDYKFRVQFEQCFYDLKHEITQIYIENPEAPYTHLLNMDPEFLDFVRLGLGIRKIGRKAASKIKEMVDGKLQSYLSKMIKAF